MPAEYMHVLIYSCCVYGPTPILTLPGPLAAVPSNVSAVMFWILAFCNCRRPTKHRCAQLCERTEYTQRYPHILRRFVLQDSLNLPMRALPVKQFECSSRCHVKNIVNC